MRIFRYFYAFTCAYRLVTVFRAFCISGRLLFRLVDEAVSIRHLPCVDATCLPSEVAMAIPCLRLLRVDTTGITLRLPEGQTARDKTVRTL